MLPREGGDFSVLMGLDDDQGALMTLELMAPSRQQARQLARTFHDYAEEIYQAVVNALLERAEQAPAGDPEADGER